MGLPRAEGGCDIELMYGLEGEPPGPNVGTSWRLIDRGWRDMCPMSWACPPWPPTEYMASRCIVQCYANRFPQ